MEIQCAKSEPAPATNPPSEPQAAKEAEATVTLPSDELAWAQAHAAREGTTVATVVTDVVRKPSQAEAEAWLREVNPDPAPEELEAVMREWRGAP